MIESARPRAALWRLFLGILTVVIVSFAWAAAIILLASWIIGTEDVFATLDGLTGTPGPAGTITALLTIVGFGAGSFLAVRLWHKRSIGSLFGAAAKTWRHFFVAAGLTFTAMAILSAASLPFIGWPLPGLDVRTWIAFLPLALFAIWAQTGAEEVLFRGYLQSQLAARFKSPLAWLFAPSLLFGALHYTPGHQAIYVTVVVVGTFAFGLMAADLTARTGSIGAAWGFHFANNTLVILFFSSQSSFSGLSLYTSAMPMEAIDGFSMIFILDLLIVTAIWVMIRRALAT